MLTHPQVGDIELNKNKLTIGGTDSMTLVVYHASPGTRDAELLALLGSLTASASASAETETEAEDVSQPTREL